MIRRVSLLSLVGGIVAFVMFWGATSVFAALTHYTTGYGLPHSTGSHSINPGHLKISMKAPSSGTISSGGVFHDGCTSSSATGNCRGAFGGSDWALDIASSGGSSIKLYLDYAGQAGTGATVIVDKNEDMTIQAKSVLGGNFRNPVDAACYWRKYDILVTYWDTFGNKHTKENLGSIWFAHGTSWSHTVGTTISTNASRSHPGGTGMIHYMNGVTVGNVYTGSGACSSGSHLHFEAVSDHAWGSAYEWHSAATDPATGSTGDGYQALSGVSNHIHRVDNSYPGGTTDSITQGSQILGFIGSDTTMKALYNNPYTANH